jgi:hypothetical protein
MHNFSELFGILKALIPPLIFIPVCISLFRNIVLIKYGRTLPVQDDNEASQVSASSLMQNQGATYNTLLIHSVDKYFCYATT